MGSNLFLFIVDHFSEDLRIITSPVGVSATIKVEEYIFKGDHSVQVFTSTLKVKPLLQENKTVSDEANSVL